MPRTIRRVETGVPASNLLALSFYQSDVDRMKIDLTGKTALVSGSTGGIGLAIAKGLANAGASVVVNGRKQATVDRAIAAIHSDVKGCRGIRRRSRRIDGARMRHARRCRSVGRYSDQQRRHLRAEAVL